MHSVFMLVIDSYLKELVENNRRVIIPDLGAFLLKENENGTKSVIFSSFLRYNDGFLEESIAEKTNMKASEVSNAVKKFVNEIRKLLRNKKNYTIDGFGYFSLDEKGAVQFYPYNEVLSEPSMEEIRPENKPIESGIEKEADIEPVVNNDAPIVNDVAADTIVNESPPVIPPVVPPAVPPKPPVINTTENTQAPKPQSGNAPSDTSTIIKQTYDLSVEAKKRTRLLWVIVFLLVIIVFLLSLLYLCTTNSDLCFLRNKKPQVTEQAKIINSIPNESAMGSNNNDSSKMLVAPSATVNDGLQYHVIAGCFSEKINAERFLQRSFQQGYVNAEMLPQIGDLYPVSIAKSPDFQKAEQIQLDYNDKYDEEAWLYRTY